MQAVKYFLKDLPSGGILPHKLIKNFNRKTFSIELSGLSYQTVLEMDKEKSTCSSKLEKLNVLLKYLVPENYKDLPLCDMFYIMLQVSLLSGLDFIGDEKRKIEFEQKNPGVLYKNQPYYMSNIVCPSCGKVHKNVPFGLEDIEIVKLEEDLIAGKKKWKDQIVFDFNGKFEYYDFKFPTIREFHNSLQSYLTHFVKPVDEDYYLQLKMIILSTALSLHEENKIIDEVDTIDFIKKFEDLKEVLRNITGGDAMKLESIYSDLIQPIAFINFKCDCKGASSVVDITYSITDVLRLIFINRGRVIQEIYSFSEEFKS